MIRTKEYMNRFRRVRTNADGQIRFKLPDREKGVEPYVYLSLYEKEYVHRKRIFCRRIMNIQLASIRKEGI